MASREELIAANAKIRRVLDAGAEVRLRAIPGQRVYGFQFMVCHRQLS